MLGADPPRRPPIRNGLTRSKSCHEPTRRKRGREVLEDITWIVNHPSSWQNGASSASTSAAMDREDGSLGRTVESFDEAAEDALPGAAGPSSARLLGLPASRPMARARSDTSLPSLDVDNNNNSNTTARPRFNELLNAPRATISRITNLDSSSPPSSPQSFSRYGSFSGGNSDGGSSGLRTHGLSRAATLPFLTTASASSSNTTPTMGRRASGAISPSLRAPPPLRRTNSGSSISSMDGSSVLSGSPMMLASPFLGSSVLQRASNVQEGGTSSLPPHSLPIPTIQREMPSPERKRSRRVVLEDEDEEEEDLEDTDEE